MLLRSDVMLRIVMLPFGQLWYHFVMIEIPMGLLFEELKMDSGKWKVNVSTAWIYLKYIAEGDTTTVHCQLSTFHCEVSNSNLSI